MLQLVLLSENNETIEKKFQKFIFKNFPKKNFLKKFFEKKIFFQFFHYFPKALLILA